MTVSSSYGRFATTKCRGCAAECRLHGVIELPNAGKSCGKGDRRQGQIRLIDEETGSLSATTASQFKRTNANFSHKFAVQVPFADDKAVGKPTDSLDINYAIGDQAQRASYEVGADVPVRRSWTGFWMAAATRSKPGSLCRGGTWVETHVTCLRRLCGANRPAVNARRGNRRKETSIKARIAAAKSAIAYIEIVVNVGCIHISIIRQRAV
jgi:hypothetical protein